MINSYYYNYEYETVKRGARVPQTTSLIRQWLVVFYRKHWKHIYWKYYESIIRKYFGFNITINHIGEKYP